MPNYSSIEQLSRDDPYWRNMAAKICNYDSISDDLLNDFYITAIILFENDKVINNTFVYTSIKNAYINYVKRQKKLDFGLEHAPAIIPDKPDDYNDVVVAKIEMEKLYDVVDDRVRELSWYENKLFNYSQIMNIKQLADKTNISYKSLCYSLKKIKIKLGYKNIK